MISDEPDEDADILDDETLLESYLGIKPPIRSAGDHGDDLPDWPQRRGRDLCLNLDAETIAWFKARYTDWQATMASVLRAWVAVQKQPVDHAEAAPGKSDDPCASVSSPTAD